MERLTERTKAGQAYYKKCFGEPCNGRIEKDCPLCNFHAGTVCERLAAYEDIGVSPEKLHEVSDMYLDRCKEINRLRAELEEYKDAEEQGLLLRLQFPLGTKIYYVDEQSTDVEEYIVNGMQGMKYTVAEPEDTEVNVYYLCSFPSAEIGKTVFLTKKEAEQALKQMGE